MPFEYMQLECSWNTVRIEDELGTIWHVRPAMRLGCFECCWNAPCEHLEYSQNTLRMPFDIFQLRTHLECFQHVKNIRVGHKNRPEYLECTRNAVRIFRMHFEYPGMCQEFSFRQDSGLFRLQCDQGIKVTDKSITLCMITRTDKRSRLPLPQMMN